MTDLRTLGRQTLVYGLSGAAPQIVGLLTLPIVARALSTEDYGVLELATVTVGLVAIVADLGLSSASQRSYFDYTDEQQIERRRVLATALAAGAFSACSLAAVALALRAEIARALFGTTADADVVALMAGVLVATQLGIFAREVLRLHFWTSAYLTSAVIAAALTGVVSVVGVTVVNGGANAILVGALVGAAAGGAYGLHRARGQYMAHLSRNELRRMLSYGIPLVPTAMAMWALTFVDRLLLEHLGSLSLVGEYAMANRLASIVLLAVTAFGIAFAPFALDLRIRDPEHERTVRAQALTAVVAVLAVVSATVSVFAREALVVLAPHFESAADVVGLLCVGTLVWGIASIVMLEISIARRTRIFAVYSLLGAAVNVALNVALIPPLGIVGAGIATASAFCIVTAAYWWHAQNIAYTPYNTRLVVELVLASTLVGALGLLPVGPLWFLVKVAGLGSLIALLVIRGILRPRILRAMLETAGLSTSPRPQ